MYYQRKFNWKDKRYFDVMRGYTLKVTGVYNNIYFFLCFLNLNTFHKDCSTKNFTKSNVGYRL